MAKSLNWQDKRTKKGESQRESTYTVKKISIRCPCFLKLCKDRKSEKSRQAVVRFHGFFLFFFLNFWIRFRIRIWNRNKNKNWDSSSVPFSSDLDVDGVELSKFCVQFMWTLASWVGLESEVRARCGVERDGDDGRWRMDGKARCVSTEWMKSLSIYRRGKEVESDHRCWTLNVL